MNTDNVGSSSNRFRRGISSTPSSAARSRVKLLLHATTGMPNARARNHLLPDFADAD